MSADRDDLTRVLAPHWRTDCSDSANGVYVRWVRCRCGWESPRSTSRINIPDMHEVWNEHLADALAPLLAEREAKARREVAADALEQAATQWGANHGVRQWLRAKARAVREGR